jgi:hypothetical protein
MGRPPRTGSRNLIQGFGTCAIPKQRIRAYVRRPSYEDGRIRERPNGRAERYFHLAHGLGILIGSSGILPLVLRKARHGEDEQNCE